MMHLLLDTHILLWAVAKASRLSVNARSLIGDQRNVLHFSSASIWEISIKSSKKQPGFAVDPHLLRTTLRNDGYSELSITGEHAIAVRQLPLIHHDPFDRILIAQASVEGFSLITADSRVSRYHGPIVKV